MPAGLHASFDPAHRRDAVRVEHGFKPTFGAVHVGQSIYLMSFEPDTPARGHGDHNGETHVDWGQCDEAECRG